MSLRDDEVDPTGMRELLRSLPDPGPMPDDLVARIRSALADLPPLSADGAATPDDVPRETGTSGGSPWWARHGGKLAVAAVLVVGGGAVASGQLGLLAGQGGSSSDSAAAGSSGSDERAVTEDGSAAHPDAFGAESDAGPVVVRMSGRSYTAAGLAAEVKGAQTAPQTAPRIGPLTAESPAIGPIGSELGVRSCLEGLGLPRGSGADVDLAFVDGTPAAVLVVTVGGGRTAYAVGRDCSTGNPSLLAGPVPVP